MSGFYWAGAALGVLSFVIGLTGEKSPAQRVIAAVFNLAFIAAFIYAAIKL
jgi:VIT1/CCC1 family predicted Fe2+/Mn2+ transporter